MFFEIASSLAVGGLAGVAYLKKSGLSNDVGKIQKICFNCGLYVKEGEDKNP